MDEWFMGHQTPDGIDENLISNHWQQFLFMIQNLCSSVKDRVCSPLYAVVLVLQRMP